MQLGYLVVVVVVGMLRSIRWLSPHKGLCVPHRINAYISKSDQADSRTCIRRNIKSPHEFIHPRAYFKPPPYAAH